MIRYRLLSWVALVALCFMPMLAQAQGAAQPAASSPTVEQLQQLVSTLKNDKARAQLVDQLQALIAAQNAQQQETSPFAWISQLPDQIDAIGGEILEAVPVLLHLPRTGHWIERQINDPGLRDYWVSVFQKLATFLGAGIVAGALVRLLSRGAASRLTRATRDNWGARLLLLALGALVEALPALAFAATVAFVAPMTEPDTGTRGVATVIAATAIWAWALVAMAHVLLLAPAAQNLYPLSEETRNYLYIWIRRFAFSAAIGYAASTGAWWLGAPSAIVGLLIRVSILVLAILAIIFVLQNRNAVASWLRGDDDRPKGGWRSARRRFAETWHLLAIVYIVGSFGVFIVNDKGGLSLLLRATALSLLVITTAAILVRFIDQTLQRAFAVGPELSARFPTLEARANRYVPILYTAGSIAIYALAAIALLQAWGLSAFTWLRATAGTPVASSALSIVVVIAFAVVGWELFDAGLDRYLRRLEADSRRRARARTLFPLLRLIMIIVLSVILVFVVLAQIGINLGALIAGAGIFGIIAGLGLQPLLLDFLTSISVLLDDTFAVGDVIDVGNGRSGVVEAMSIRAVKLRAFDGSLLTVPFSEVKAIQNLTKDYSFYVANIGVAYREDTDRVTQVLVEVAEQMRQEPEFGACMLAPLEVVGVDKFAESAVILVVRIKTLPIHQWRVGREFNRRFKKAFDEQGIQMPFLQRTIYFGGDEQKSKDGKSDANGEERDGTAPAATIARAPAHAAARESAD